MESSLGKYLKFGVIMLIANLLAIAIYYHYSATWVPSCSCDPYLTKTSDKEEFEGNLQKEANEPMDDKMNLQNFNKIRSSNFAQHSKIYVRNCVTQEIIGTYTANASSNIYEPFFAKDIENATERAKKFQNVFDKRAWGTNSDIHRKELVSSGTGSTLDFAQPTIAALHVTINYIKQKLGLSRIKFLDIPCGDMAWMSKFLRTRDDIDYTGMDIVPNIIQNHEKVYNKYPWKFVLADIVNEPVPGSYHLVLSRAMLQHLTNKDIATVLDKISKSGSNYALLTTWPKESSTQELAVTDIGRNRPLNLEIPPVNLSPALCVIRDSPQNAADMLLGLWKLPFQQIKECKEPLRFKLWPNDVNISSCTDWSYK